MSETVRSADAGEDAGSPRALARALIPVLIAAASVALVVVAIRSHAVEITEITAGSDEPTPYSAMEGRIPQPTGPEEAPAPTF